MMDVRIQPFKNIECHLSPHDKHFADVNVLGADFLVKNGLKFKANYSSIIVLWWWRKMNKTSFLNSSARTIETQICKG